MTLAIRIRRTTSLISCSYTTEAFSELLSRITPSVDVIWWTFVYSKSWIDRLSLEGYANLEIRIQNQVTFLNSLIEYARETWIKQLHDWIGEHLSILRILMLIYSSGVACCLRCVQSSRYEIGLQIQKASTTYTSLAGYNLFCYGLENDCLTDIAVDALHG